MDLRQLRHFVAAAEEQHFSRAARRANVVQSALSTSVRSLEEELGAQLFVRTTRQVRLTEAWLQGRVEVPEIRAKWRDGRVVDLRLEVPPSVPAGGRRSGAAGSERPRQQRLGCLPGGGGTELTRR